MKKFLSLLLALLLVASLLVSCDGVGEQKTDLPSDTASEPTTSAPTEEPTAEATVSAFGTESTPPTDEPISAPTEAPTSAPTEEPTSAPTEEPTSAPTEEPTSAPTEEPTSAPTEEPTSAPTEEPTSAPTEVPTSAPTEVPTSAPTEEPTSAPTEEPTSALTEEPTFAPTEEPTFAPTEEPTSAPTEEPTEPESETQTEHKYKHFTAADVKLIRDTVGTMIPFIPTDEYELSTMTLPDGKTLGIDFTTYGNTRDEVLDYLGKFSAWTLTFIDLDNDFGYSFVEYRRNNLVVEIHFATDAEKYLIVLVYPNIIDTTAPTDELPSENPTEKPSEVPTSAPTEEPTSAPTEEPTSAPTEEPTSAPTEEPTSAPTEEPTGSPIPPVSEEKVLSFADTSARVSITATSQGEQVWSANGITLTNVGHVGNYANPVRLYKNTTVTITCADMSVLVFNCFNEDYASALVTSLGDSAVADGKTVTLVLPAAVNEIAFTCASQIRLDSLIVNPSTSGGTETEPPVEDPTTDPSTPPAEPEINYGTLEDPVTTTYAYQVNASLRNEEFSASPFYVKGTVTAIESTGNYYKNVYITDGVTKLHIYTINMGDGVTSFEVGDVIVAYGYFVNYNNDIGLATYKPDPETKIFVYAVKVEAGEGGEGGNTPPSENHTYTDFTSEEKDMLTNTFGFVIPFIPNDEYYVDDLADFGLTGINFYAFDNTPAEFDAYRALFSDYTYDGTETDTDGVDWYFYYKDNAYVEMYHYFYEDYYVTDVYVYLIDEGEDPTTAPETPTQEPTTTPETPTEEPTDAPVGPTVPSESTLSFADKANRTEFSGEIQVWKQNGITLTNNKGSSSSAVADYANPARFYASSSVTIERNGMLKIVFECNAEKYVTALVNSLNGVSGASVSSSGTTVTLEFNSPVDELTFTCAAQIRLNSLTVTSNSQGGSGDGGESGDTPPSSSHTYTDFTSDEKAMFTDAFGFVIPFIPNDEYYVEEYEFEGESGINFYAFGNTSAEFNAYLSLFSSYTNDGTDTDEYGDIWYFYSNGDVYIDMCYYLYDDAYIVDVYVYVESEGGSGGESGGNTTPSDLITNDGAGLPEDDGDGVHDVDFTKGQYVQNVTDQGYYLDGCPTTGAPAVLVIPVEFSDVPAGEGYTTDNIEKIFNGTGNDTTYHSVHEYFFMSSYETLDLQITVLDEWFRPANTSTYYANQTYEYYGSEMAIGDQLVLDEALAYLEGIMDLSVFDSDGNNVIDAVVMVTTLEINSDVNFYWAYRYWNVYTDDEGYYFEYDGVSANDYAWIPYDFMFEDYDEETGEVNYDKSNPLNPYTFIHEFGHVLGADDYYDTSYTEHPLGGADMMDAMQGDHNPYTKFNYGWLTSSRLITTKSEVTITLDAFANSGDTVIIANNWDENLGAYQEYFVVMYYTNTGLNSGEGGYFQRDGVVVYHINASLYSQTYGDETYYDVYFNNTDPSDQYGTEENLIEFVKHPDGEDMIYTYVAGDSLPAVSDDSGNALGYTFTVDSLTDTTATLTFKALN